MQINPAIFKAYDIRGIYPNQINEETVYQIGRAFVEFLKADKVVVGRDTRLSSPALAKSLIKGLTDQGADVLDIGLASTPMMCFGLAKHGLTGGINVTASHNPKEYNGLKLYRGKARPLGSDSGLIEIQKLSLNSQFKSSVQKGKITKKDILDDYLNNIFRFTKPKEISNFKIVADAGNGLTGLIFPKFFDRLNCQVIPLFWDLDGSFPNHSPNPRATGSLDVLKMKIIEEKADLGIAFDGDADRIIFVDERGEAIRSDFITALIAEMILKEQPGQKIIYNVGSSRVVKEIIQENNGQALLSKVGHSFVQEQLVQEGAIFAGEVSGHYFLRDNYNSGSPFIIALYLLKLLSQKKKKISQIIEPLKRYYISEINFEIGDKDIKSILEKVEEIYQPGEISHLDGLSVEFSDWWFNLRPSNTEPLLRLTIEAKTEDLIKEKTEEISQLVKEK